jgi:hypothetical protein
MRKKLLTIFLSVLIFCGIMFVSTACRPVDTDTLYAANVMEKAIIETDDFNKLMF